MIQDLFDAIKARMPVGFKFELGAKHLQANTAPPRIVVVPTTEQFVAPQHGRDGQGHPRKSVSARHPTLAFHLWGRDYAESEGLLHDLVNVLHQDANTSFSLGAAFWLDAERAPWLKHGEVYVLPVQFKTQIIQSATFATLAAIAQESAVEK